jgi:hypothetical protein
MKIRQNRTLRKLLNALQGDSGAEAVRQPNTAGLRSKLSVSQQGELYRLSEHPGYQVLLDVMEMACVEQDTRLINTDAANPEAVLTEHRMSKAFWQIFVAIQKKVEYERGEFLGAQHKQQQPDEVSEEDADTNILGL